MAAVRYATPVNRIIVLGSWKHFRLTFSVPENSSPLRKAAAYHDLPSLSSPARPSNPRSYPTTQPLPGIRTSNETTLVLSLLVSKQVLWQDAADSIISWIPKFPASPTIDMFRSSEKHGSTPSTPEDSPYSWTPRSKVRSWNLTPRKIIFIFLALFSIVFLNSFLSHFNNHGVCNSSLYAKPSLLTNMIPSLIVQRTSRRTYHTMQPSSPTLPSNLLSHFLTATQTQSIPFPPTSTATRAIFHPWISMLPSLLYVQTVSQCSQQCLLVAESATMLHICLEAAICAGSRPRRSAKFLAASRK